MRGDFNPGSRGKRPVFPKGKDGRDENEVMDFFQRQNFKDEWITIGIDKDFIDFAENIGKFMAKKGLTNSKIRSIYGEMKRIQMGTFEKEKSSFYLLRPKVAYAYGRDRLNKGLELFKILFDKCADKVVDQKTFTNFSQIFEAVLAYHKAFGGKD